VLLWDVYHWKSAARERPRGWVDPPSASILQLYRIVYDAAGETFGQHGLPELSARADSVANAVARNLVGRGGR
jgi:hypothetical protein